MNYADFIPQEGHYAIDVGAHDGVFQSVTLGLERAGWEVICCEGNPDLFGRLVKSRRFAFPFAIGPICKEMVPFHINDTAPASHTGLIGDSNCTRTVQVPQRTLTWCLEQVGWPRLDLLSIDVEGAELGVLQGLDWERWKPMTIFAENWAPEGDRTLADLLEPLGYEFKGKILYDEVYQWVK